MANKKITDLVEGTELVDNDLLPYVDTLTAPTATTKAISKANLLKDKADKTNVLELDNTDAFTPDADYEPATKKYVDDSTSGFGTGDMDKATYDPTNVGADAFDYGNFSNTPTIPADTGDLTNNAGFITSGDIPAETDPVFTAWDKDYDDLSNKPTIPTLPSIATGSEIDTGTDNDKMVTAKAIADSGVAYTSDIPSVPVKAIGSEVDTGTDDAKFLTAKSINDSHNVPLVAPSTAGNIMTSDGTDWVSSTPSASGSFTIGLASAINNGIINL